MLAAPLLGGCATDTENGPLGATIAFESIDGPPRPVFDRLVTRLDAEARARQIAVVTRQGPARYRVRAYLAAKIERRKAAIAWVWDVYDVDLRRAVRIGGEEPAGRSGKDAWAAADDQVLGRIAEAGMKQLAVFTAGRGVAPDNLPAAREAPPPQPAEPPVAPPADNVQVAAVTPAPTGAAGRSR
jgi:hypothetical protein